MPRHEASALFYCFHFLSQFLPKTRNIAVRNFTDPAHQAQVAELVDAADSKSAVRKNVSVRLRSRAHRFHDPNNSLYY